MIVMSLVIKYFVKFVETTLITTFLVYTKTSLTTQMFVLLFSPAFYSAFLFENSRVFMHFHQSSPLNQSKPPSPTVHTGNETFQKWCIFNAFQFSTSETFFKIYFWICVLGCLSGDDRQNAKQKVYVI